MERATIAPENVIWNLQLEDKNRSYEFMHEIYIKLIGIPFYRVENRWVQTNTYFKLKQKRPSTQEYEV